MPTQQAGNKKMQQINELQRVEQDKQRFNTICESIGFNNAVDGEFNTIEKDFKKIQFCRALIMQMQKPSRAEIQAGQQIKQLKAGHKIRLGGF